MKVETITKEVDIITYSDEEIKEWNEYKKQNNLKEGFYYSIYFDILYKNKGELSIEDYLKTFLPKNSYAYACDWQNKFIILSPEMLLNSTIKEFNLEQEKPAYDYEIERFKVIAEYFI